MVFTIRDESHASYIGIATNLEGISKILIDYITDVVLEAEAETGDDYSAFDIPLTVNESLKNFNLDNKYTQLCIKSNIGNDLFDCFLFNIEIMKYQLNVYQ